MEQQHRVAARKFIIIRNQLLHIIVELHLKVKLKQVTLEYEKILNNLNQLYLEVPSTTDEAVKSASNALKFKKDYTYTDRDIDQFLPNSLRTRINLKDVII